jgi:hypothetical protein
MDRSTALETRGLETRVLIAMVIGAVMSLFAFGAPASAATAPLAHDANAYGSRINLGGVVSSGPTALATLGCTTQAGLDHTNSAASVVLPGAGSVGAINDEVSTTANSTNAQSNAAAVNLGGGVVTADAVTATATASKGGAGFATNGDTTVLNLVVAGTPISAPVPNTVVPLPGIGTLTVNEQISHVTNSSASMIVNALHIRLGASNPLGLPAGANIVVGHARAVLQAKQAPFLDGMAYASQINATVASAGKSALVRMPCHGTDGVVHTNTTVGVAVPLVLTTGTATSTATGTASHAMADGVTTDTIQDVDLLGMVTAQVVTAHAHASRTGNVDTFSTAGSKFENISVMGVTLPPDGVKPNSHYDLPGVGTLYLHRVIRGTHHIEVRMIELVLTAPVPGLPVGADIRIGVAEASVH